MIRSGLLIITGILSVSLLFGQGSDTIKLTPVTIQAKPIYSLSGFKQTDADTTALRSLDYASLADLLSRHTPIFIKSYGQGNLATASFRGTSASHTKVLWNGMEINHPMLSQTDFSQISLAAADNVSLAYGGAGINQGNGSLGGSILIESSPENIKKFSFNARQSVASFQNYRSEVVVKAKHKNLKSRTVFSTQTADNNFPFKNIYKDRNQPPVERRKHAGYENAAFLQELFYQGAKGSQLTGRVWLQNHFREIAPPLGAEHAQSSEEQSSEALRAMVDWERKLDRIEISAKSGYVYDNLHYQNSLALVNSKNYAYRFIQQGKVKTDISKELSWRGSLSYEHIKVASNNYDIHPTRRDFTVYSNLHWHPDDILAVQLMLRQKNVDGTWIPLIPSAGFELKPFSDHQLRVTGNLSRNYRLPSLNDLYWEPGGDPQLNPEKGFSMESGLHFTTQKSRKWQANVSLTAYRSDISNWISWQPDSIMSYWTPQNISQVLSKGLELNYAFLKTFNVFKAGFEQTYAFTSAQYTDKKYENDAALKKQLAYVPQHQVQSSLKMHFTNLSVLFYHRYTGKRYTTSDNTSYMPGFSVVDLAVSKKIKVNKKWQGSIMARVNNLTDKDYQLVAWYPMPGRNFQITMQLKFDKP